MKNFLYLLLFTYCLSLNAQNGRAQLNYFLNEKHQKTKDAKVFIITEKDTTELSVKRDKVIIPKMEATFELLIKVNNEEFKFPKCLAEMSIAEVQIIFGKITDKKTLHKITDEFKKNYYLLNNTYTIYVKDLNSFEELNFITISFSKNIDNHSVTTKEIGTTQIIR